MDGFLQQDKRLQSGFTLIELVIVLGIIAILFTLATVNLVTTQHTTTVSAAVDELVGDMRVQQTKAMTGTKDTNGNPNSYGISFTSSGYKLFQGTTDPNDSSDFAVTPAGITFSNNLPSNVIDFTERSGEFANYVNGTTYTVTVKNANGPEQKTLTINRYGVVTSIQ